MVQSVNRPKLVHSKRPLLNYLINIAIENAVISKININFYNTNLLLNISGMFLNKTVKDFLFVRNILCTQTHHLKSTQTHTHRITRSYLLTISLSKHLWCPKLHIISRFLKSRNVTVNTHLTATRFSHSIDSYVSNPFGELFATFTKLLTGKLFLEDVDLIYLLYSSYLSECVCVCV